MALQHLTIYRHALARAHEEQIADHHRCHVYVEQLSVALDPRLPRLQANELLDGGRRATPGARLQQLAQEHQCDDRSAGLEVHVLRVQGEQRDDGAEEIRGAGAERNQHVHVGATSAQRVPGSDIEAPAAPELHRCRERQLQPPGQQIAVMTGEHPDHLRDQR